MKTKTSLSTALLLVFTAFALSACQKGLQTADGIGGDSGNGSASVDPGLGGGANPNAGDDINIFKEVAEPMGQAVDAQYSSSRELMPVRSGAQNFAVDSCDPALQGHDRFADRIAYAVHKRMVPMAIDIGSSVAPIFNLSTSKASYMPTGLLSHPFCRVTKDTLIYTYENYRIPTDATIAKAQAFTDKLNLYRTQALNGSREGAVSGRKLWTKFMMCLGYMESLTSADSAESEAIASSFGFRRPAGVNLHNDSNQTNADSVLGIGIFQISNVVQSGDTYSCVTDWNRQFPACPISTGSSKTAMIPILGSAVQTFNAYCGAAFVTRMFGVQVNALAAKNTHPDNVLASGKLKAPADRCVTPFMNVNRSYNHFAPLQNGSGFTLDNILSCTMKDQ